MAPSRPPCEIIADPRVARVNSGAMPAPADWGSRALYPGSVGAHNWLAVVNEPNYPLRNPDCLDLRRNRRAALEGRRFATLVSLGPGDGIPDIDLVSVLRGPLANPLTCIPVDIALELLETAIANLTTVCEVPAGILCDFEDGQDFIQGAVERLAPHPILYSLLGGTVGNLDRGERPFFAGLRRMMEPADAFLLDVPIAGPGWSSDQEPRLRTDAYTGSFRAFLAQGLVRAGADDATSSHIEVDPLGDTAFTDRAEFELCHDDETGAERVTVKDRETRRLVLSFRRYRWDNILRFFQDQGFRVAFSASSIKSDSDRFGMGVVLLTT